MTEAFADYLSVPPHRTTESELELVPDGPGAFELALGKAIAAGSDWVIDYRGCTPGKAPRRYLKPAAAARYAQPALRAAE